MDEHTAPAPWQAEAGGAIEEVRRQAGGSEPREAA